MLVLADDLTGALEAGAKLRGLVSTVPVETDKLLVLDTETRHLSPECAAQKIRTLVNGREDLIYLKTDSTLRGNIAAELGVFRGDRIAYIPAYPAMGRTVRDGELLVHGVPVHLTSFASDALNPVTCSSVKQLVGDLPCTIYDGETREDVARAVAEALAAGCRIIAGPASVAEALVGQVPDLPFPRFTACAIINGSRHEASRRQVEYATAAGCAAPWQIVPKPVWEDYEALMIFGGDTAYAILTGMGCTALEPLGEAVPGVPVSRVVGRNLHLITKAGGFGDETLICRVREKLGPES